MGTFSFGSSPPVEIVNRQSDGDTAGLYAGENTSSKVILSGACTADTLKEVINISGGGVVQYLAVGAADSTTREVRAELVIDGVTCFDATATAVAVDGRGIVVIGGAGISAAVNTAPLDSIPFKNSLVFSISTSITETDKLAAYAQYYLT